MRQSLYIISQCINFLPGGLVCTTNDSFNTPLTFKYKSSMEALIQHFNLYSSGFNLYDSKLYTSIESPKGEFGVYLLANKESQPYRVKIHSPGFFNLQSLNFLSKNHFLADVVTLIGTLDIVFGEIDR